MSGGNVVIQKHPRYRVVVTDPTKSEDYDVIVGRFKQRAACPCDAILLVQAREFAGCDTSAFRFMAYL